MTNPNPSAALIPSNAIIYAQVGSLGELMSNIDQFMLKAGLTESIQNMSVREFINLMLAMQMPDMNLDWINQKTLGDSHPAARGE
jgi:hypothetical protein